jgi:DNA-binding transcriptional LysR family regulator
VRAPVTGSSGSTVPIQSRPSSRRVSRRLLCRFSAPLLPKPRLDLAIRNGPVPGNETSLIARVIARQELVLVAAPTYLDRAGDPASLDALMRHRTVRYSRHSRPRSWSFEVDAQILQIDPPTAFMADHIETLLDAAYEGAGIARLPSWLVAEGLRDGRLRRVLPHEPPPIINVYLVRPVTRIVPTRVMMVGDYLATTLAQSMKA